MKHAFLIVVLAAFCSESFCFAGTDQAPMTSNTLNQQYKNLKADQEVIDGFRMVKLFSMDRFWAVVEDSLAEQKVRLDQHLKKINEQNKDLAALNASLQASQAEKSTLVSLVDNIVVFGDTYSKKGFVTVVALVVAGLLIGLVVLLIMGRNFYRTTNELRKLNESLYQEFETYKRNAVEKEVKILRELQNYRNKIAELKVH